MFDPSPHPLPTHSSTSFVLLALHLSSCSTLFSPPIAPEPSPLIQMTPPSAPSLLAHPFSHSNPYPGRLLMCHCWLLCSTGMLQSVPQPLAPGLGPARALATQDTCEGICIVYSSCAKLSNTQKKKKKPNVPLVLCCAIPLLCRIISIYIRFCTLCCLIQPLGCFWVQRLLSACLTADTCLAT